MVTYLVSALFLSICFYNAYKSKHSLFASLLTTIIMLIPVIMANVLLTIDIPSNTFAHSSGILEYCLKDAALALPFIFPYIILCSFLDEYIPVDFLDKHFHRFKSTVDSTIKTVVPEQTEKTDSIKENFSPTLLDSIKSEIPFESPELISILNRIVDVAKRIEESDNLYQKELQSSVSTYYLPTTMKLLDQYRNQSNDSTSTESINFMIADGLQQIAEALEMGEQRCRQKKALQEMDDLRAEIAVLESKSRMDGYGKQ